MFRRYWREPGYWRWLWRDRVGFVGKAIVSAVVLALMLGGGWLAANRLAGASAGVSAAGDLTFETTIQKLVTVHEKGRVVDKLVPVVKQVFVKPRTAFQTLTDLRTNVITVQGGVRTVRSKVVVHVPVVSKKVVTVDGKTKTIVTTRLVPTTNIQTQTNTLTQVRTETQVQVQSQTQTQTLTQTQTQTQTETVTRTVTQPVTVTETATVPPVTVTVTVTQTT